MPSSKLYDTRQQTHNQPPRPPPVSGSSGIDQSPDPRDIAQYPTPPTPTYSLPPFSSITAEPPIPFSTLTWPTSDDTNTRDGYLIAPATYRSHSSDKSFNCEPLQAYVGFDEGPSSASDFVKKLYRYVSCAYQCSYVHSDVVPASLLLRMLNDPALAHIVAWGPRGDCLVVKNAPEFTSSILPGTFKHSNLASFVRQLNKYDFHKVRVCDLDLIPLLLTQSAIRSRAAKIPIAKSVYVFFCLLTSDMITCHFRHTYFDTPTSMPADGKH